MAMVSGLRGPRYQGGLSMTRRRCRMGGGLFLTLAIMLMLGPTTVFARQEVVTAVAYVAPASFADTMANSRTSFTTSETITFGTLIHTDDLPWTSVTIGVYIFDQLGKLRHAGSESVSGTFGGLWRLVTTVSSGTLPAGQYRWLMAVTGSDGTTFTSTLQPLVIQ